jgi:hypothetical protein
MSLQYCPQAFTLSAVRTAGLCLFNIVHKHSHSVLWERQAYVSSVLSTSILTQCCEDGRPVSLQYCPEAFTLSAVRTAGLCLFSIVHKHSPSACPKNTCKFLSFSLQQTAATEHTLRVCNPARTSCCLFCSWHRNSLIITSVTGAHVIRMSGQVIFWQKAGLLILAAFQLYLTCEFRAVKVKARRNEVQKPIRHNEKRDETQKQRIDPYKFTELVFWEHHISAKMTECFQLKSKCQGTIK